MKATFLLPILMFTCGTGASSSFMADAQEIMQLLQKTTETMDQLSNCYATGFQAKGTMQEKRRCLATLVRFASQAQSQTQPQTRRSHSPKFGNRRRCRPFHGWAC